MPHVVVKLVPGKSEEQKSRLAAAIVKDVMATLGYDEGAVSVALEEVPREDWAEKVYKNEIRAHWKQLYKEPGYNPFQ
jgi:4-oxalocrotonate tautomerase